MGSSDETTGLCLLKQLCQLGCITLKPFSQVSLFFPIYLNRNNFKISMVSGPFFRWNSKCPPSPWWHLGMISMSVIHVALDYPIKNHFHAHFQYVCIPHSIAMPTTFSIAFSPPPWRFNSIRFWAPHEVPYGMWTLTPDTDHILSSQPKYSQPCAIVCWFFWNGKGNSSF